MKDAQARYRQKRGKGLDDGNQVAGSFSKWRRRFNWVDRVREWDDEKEFREREAERLNDDEAYRRELRQFGKSQLSAGKVGFKVTLSLKGDLLAYIETRPPIRTLKDALMVARIIATIEPLATEQWAKSLHIDRLLEQMEEEESYQD
jgi:hypothetical protein